MTTQTIVEAPLSAEERGDLARHQTTIERGQQTFIEVGLALADISRRRLYRESHGSLEAWLADNYPDISRRRAYQLMGSAETAQQLVEPAEDVNPGTQLPPPTSERQLRPLAGLEPEQKREAYQQAVEAAGGKAPTAAQVEQAARAARPAPTPPPPAPTPVAATATPAPAGEVIAEMPATPPAPPPLPVAPPLIPLGPAPSMDAAGLRQAEALVALLEQALSVAQVERDRLQREQPDRLYTLPDGPVEEAARNFLANPAVKAAAGFLAMSAKEGQ